MIASPRTARGGKPSVRKAAARPAPLSVKAYARHRGASPAAVRRAIRDGRLTGDSVGRDARGRPCITNPTRADQEWASRTRPKVGLVRKGAAGTPSGLALATQRERESRAKLAELEYDRKSGSLVRAAEVEIRWAATVVALRTGLLGLPTRAKQRLPHLTVADLGVLEALIRETLEELADRGTGSSNGDAR